MIIMKRNQEKIVERKLLKRKLSWENKVCWGNSPTVMLRRQSNFGRYNLKTKHLYTLNKGGNNCAQWLKNSSILLLANIRFNLIVHSI